MSSDMMLVSYKLIAETPFTWVTNLERSSFILWIELSCFMKIQ